MSLTLCCPPRAATRTHAVRRRSSVIPIITTPLSAAAGPCCYDIGKLRPPVSTPGTSLPAAGSRSGSNFGIPAGAFPPSSGPWQAPHRPRSSQPLSPRSARPTPTRSRRAAAPPALLSSPPRCLGAPQSAAPLPAPPRPRPASTGVPYGDHTTTPTLPSAGRAAVRTAGPVTHTRGAIAWAQETKLEHGRRPPTPRDLSRVPPNSRIRRRGGGGGEGPGPRGAPPHSPG